MFPTEHRLRHEKDIKALFAKSKSVFGLYVGMRFRKNTQEHTRIAVVCGTKVHKSAVVRNRLKRQVRAIVHERLTKIPPGYDILFFLRKEALDANFDQLKEQIETSLKKAKLV
jgi:ribonuclease P protein component